MTLGPSEPFGDDGRRHVNGHGDPYLDLDGVGRPPEEALDAQVLFDPAEEEFDLAAVLVKPGHHQGRQLEVIGGIDKEAAVWCVLGSWPKGSAQGKNAEKPPGTSKSLTPSCCLSSRIINGL